jgi:phosphate transport system substrate-binding protein
MVLQSYTHYSNSQVNFTVEQIWQALAEQGSKPEKWSDIDPSLPNIKISVLVPPPTSGTRDAFNELVMKKGCPKTVDKKKCELLREDGAAIEAGENDTLIINKLVGDKNYFGILGFSYYDSNKDKVRAVTINGKTISLKSIQDGSYPISRPLFFYVKNQHIGVIPGIEQYIKEFTSKRAIGSKGYLTGVGLVPLANPKESNWTPNAGNFQEYTYECEWMECEWKLVHDTIHLVTAFCYPWINISYK